MYEQPRINKPCGAVLEVLASDKERGEVSLYSTDYRRPDPQNTRIQGTD